MTRLLSIAGALMTVLLSACGSFVVAAAFGTIYTFGPTRYLVIQIEAIDIANPERSGSEFDVYVRLEDGSWTYAGGDPLAETLRERGTFVRRIRSSSISYRNGQLIIPPRELTMERPELSKGGG